MKKVRIGVLGAYRGTSMINYCKIADNAEVVAICDKWKEGLEMQEKENAGLNIAYFDNFDDFIEYDMDAVVLANYATEHAPFAIRAMEKGLHVFSEVMPVQTMKEAVELVECVERTGKIYAYGENYCYMPAPYEMRRLYKENKIGELEYAECEYIHNCESIWPSITYGDKNHWRNNMYATFYCTHSIGPIIHMTGLRPVSVVGFEGKLNERSLRTGRKGPTWGIEMITLNNGAIVKSVHGGLYKYSNYYCLYGNKGRLETGRDDAGLGAIDRIYINADEYSGGYETSRLETYRMSERNDKEKAFGHGGSDFWSMYNFVLKILGDKTADIIDVYEALDMFLPGLFAYRSVLKGGITQSIPNLRNKEERAQFLNDVACTDPKVAGDQLIPVYSKGNPDIPDSIYEYLKMKWCEDLHSQTGYTHMAFHQGELQEDKQDEKNDK